MSTQRKSGSRRPAAIAVAVMMAAAIFAGLPATDFGKVYAAGETAVVATDVLNVRSGAGTNYSRIGALKEGRTFVPPSWKCQILAEVSLKQTSECFAVSSLVASHFISHFASLVT